MADIDTKFSATLGSGTQSTFSSMQKGLRQIAQELQKTAKALLGLQQTEAASAIGHTALAINKLSTELQKGSGAVKQSTQNLARLAAINKEMAGTSKVAQQAWSHFVKEVDAGRMSMGVARARALEYDKAMSNLIIDVKTVGGAHSDVSKNINFADIAMRQLSGDLEISGGRFRKLSSSAYAYLISNDKIAASVKQLHTAYATKTQKLKELAAQEKAALNLQKQESKELDKIVNVYRRMQIQYKDLLASKTKYGDAARKELQLLREQGKDTDLIRTKLQALNKERLASVRAQIKAQRDQEAAQKREYRLALQVKAAYERLNMQFGILLKSRTREGATARALIMSMRERRRSIDEVRRSMVQLNNTFVQNNKGALQLKSGFDKMFRSFKTYASYAITGGILSAIRTGFREATQAIVEHSQGLFNLKAIMQATTSEVAAMDKVIVQVAKDTKFSIGETSDTMKLLGQAGFEAQEGIAMLPSIANLATGTLESLQSTTDLTATAMRVFHKSMGQTPEVADVFANAVNKSRLTVGKLNTAFNYIGPLAHDAGLSLKDTSASMMLLANAGLRASSIGTGLRRVLVGLLKPTDSFKTAVERAGLTMKDFNPLYTSWEQILRNLPKVTKNAQDAIKQFGIRGASVVTAFINQGADEFDRLRGFVDRTGTSAAMATTQMRGLGVMLKNVKDRFGVLAVTVARAGIEEIFLGMVSVARTFLDVMIKVADSGFGRFIIQGGLVTGVIVGLGTVISNVSKLMQLQFIGSLKNAAKAMITFATTGMGPVLIAIGVALAGVVAAMGEYVHSLKETIKQQSEIAGAFNQVNKNLINYKNTVKEYGRDSKQAREASKVLGLSIKNVGSETEETAKFTKDFGGLVSTNSGLVKDYNKLINELAPAIGDGLQGAYTKATNAAVEYYQAQERLKAPMRWVTEATIKWGEWLPKIGAYLQKGFRNRDQILKDLGKGINTAVEDASRAFNDLKYSASKGSEAAIDTLENVNKSAEELAPILLKDADIAELGYNEIQNLVMGYAEAQGLAAETTGALLVQVSRLVTEARKSQIEMAKVGNEVSATLQSVITDIDAVKATDESAYIVKVGYIQKGMELVQQAADAEKAAQEEIAANETNKLIAAGATYEELKALAEDHYNRMQDIDERAAAAKLVLLQEQQQAFITTYETQLSNIENFYTREAELATNLHSQELMSNADKLREELTALDKNVKDKEKRYQLANELFLKYNKIELKETETHYSTLADITQREYESRIEMAKILITDEVKRNEKIEKLSKELLEKQKDILEKRKESYERTLDKMYGKEEELTQKIQEELDKRADFNKSIEDTLLDLKRKTLSETELYQSKLNEAEKLASDARRALAEGDAEAAQKAAKEAVDAYKDAASSIPQQIKDAGSYGDELKGISYKIKDISGTWNSASKDIVANTKDQRDEVQSYIETLKSQIGVVRTTITETVTQLQTLGASKIELDTEEALANLGTLRNYLDELTDKPRTIYIDVVKRNQFTEGSVNENLEVEGHSEGSKIPGYGGGDKINALLEPGEWIIRKEAVAKYGDAYFKMLNEMLVPKDKLPQFAEGGHFTTKEERAHGFKHRHGDTSDVFKVPDIQKLLREFKKSGDQKDLYEPLNFLANMLDTSLTNLALSNTVAGASLLSKARTVIPPRDIVSGYYGASGDSKPNMNELRKIMSIAGSNIATGAISGPATKMAFKGLQEMFKVFERSNFLQRRKDVLATQRGKLSRVEAINKNRWYRLGGSVLPQAMQFQAPMLPAIASATSSAPTINHMIKFSVGGKVSGGFTAPQSTVENFIDILKQSKLGSE